MYRILILDENTELPVTTAKSNHEYRVPGIGEHVLIKYKDQTKICEVEDVWTNVNLSQDPTYQGAVQVVVRWSKGMDPSLYVRRFR